MLCAVDSTSMRFLILYPEYMYEHMQVESLVEAGNFMHVGTLIYN